MRRLTCVVTLVLVTAASARAQMAPVSRRAVPDDSVGIGVALTSRMLWRDVTLGQNGAVLSGLELLLARGLQFEGACVTSLGQSPMFARAGARYSPYRSYPYMVLYRP